MKEEAYVKAKRAEGRADEGGWKPGVGQMLGLVLGALLVVAAIILGLTTGVGLVLAVPLAIAGLALALLVWRGGGRVRQVAAKCPQCDTPVTVPSHISEFNCPNCGSRMETRDSGLLDAR
jgi:ribosomal protein S27AE